MQNLGISHLINVKLLFKPLSEEDKKNLGINVESEYLKQVRSQLAREREIQLERYNAMAEREENATNLKIIQDTTGLEIDQENPDSQVNTQDEKQ